MEDEPIIKFTDSQGRRQSIDLSTHGSRAFNVDCMEVLKQMPDGCIDLAVVDPPYGDAGKMTRGGVLGAIRRTV